MLHAESLTFPDPATGAREIIEAAPPVDFAVAVEAAGISLAAPRLLQPSPPTP
jgi:hypothetical protein